MNLREIKDILNASLSNEIKEQLILKNIALDKNSIPNILKILNYERETKEKLIIDMNLELSRAHIYIEMKKETKIEQKDSFNKTFVLKEIENFYIKYKNIIGHCFNRFPKN